MDLTDRAFGNYRFAVFKVIPSSGVFGSRPLTVHENVSPTLTRDRASPATAGPGADCRLLVHLLPTLATPPLPTALQIVLQTTAVATGTLPLAAGLVGVIPALALLDPELDNGATPITLSFTHLLLWSLAVAFFGVFLAVPLRRQVVVKEKLVFPSGTATAQIIAVLHKVELPQEGEAKQREGYRLLDEEDARESGEAVRGAEVVMDDDEAVDVVELGEGEETTQEKIDRQGWVALTYSFVLSAGFTVSSTLSVLSR